MITITKAEKHNLPVRNSCPWRHLDHISYAEPPCRFQKGGRRPKSYDELWECVAEADCKITDQRLQMAVFRDPRAMTVSSYYHLKAHAGPGERPEGSVDDYVKKLIPFMSQWVALRHILFEGMLDPHQSLSFWYEDALGDPLRWHYRWLAFVGLQLPASVVEAARDAAMVGDFGFESKFPGDKHIGGAAVTADRTYKDELKQETLEVLDKAVRKWLPPTLLAKLRVPMLPSDAASERAVEDSDPVGARG